MREAVIVFARFDSRRLPGKALRPIAGKPMLGWVVERIRRMQTPHNIVIATSDRFVDDPITQFGKEIGIEVFRGTAEDVAGRALACAEQLDCERFTRISGDSPFIEPTLIDALLEKHTTEELDIATNIFPRSFPAGASVEVIATAALRHALADTESADDREHITPYFYRHPTKFRIGNLAAEDDRYADVHLAVDTANDFAQCVWIAERLGADPFGADLSRIAVLARACPAANDGARRQPVQASS